MVTFVLSPIMAATRAGERHGQVEAPMPPSIRSTEHMWESMTAATGEFGSRFAVDDASCRFRDLPDLA